MANTLLTPTQVTREALMILHQKLNFIGSINRDYDKSFAKDGAKIGDTLKIRLPNQYTVTDGKTLGAQDTVENSVELKIQHQKHVAMNFSSAELTLSLDDFSKRVIEPAMNVLAANIESTVLQNVYKKVYNQVDNVGQAATFKKILEGRKKLVDNLAPPTGLFACLNTQDNVDMVDALKGLFNDQRELAKQYREGYLGRTAGFDFMENTLMPAHTRGAGASYLINGATQAGATLVVDGGTGAIKAGDVFTIANVFRVHPETKESTGQLQQFVATADATSGATSLSISPAIVVTGPAKNVVAAPADNAAITFAGTASTAHGISLGYHPDAFVFGTADLIMPKGVDFASRQALDGISMRIVRQYDINNDALPCRVDVLFGAEAIRPQLAVRYANN
jgi:hypothetical protein